VVEVNKMGREEPHGFEMIRDRSKENIKPEQSRASKSTGLTSPHSNKVLTEPKLRTGGMLLDEKSSQMLMQNVMNYPYMFD